MGGSWLLPDVPIQLGRVDPDLIREITARMKDFWVRNVCPGIEGEGDLPLLDLKRRPVCPDRVRSVRSGSTTKNNQEIRPRRSHIGRKLVSASDHPFRRYADELIGDRVFQPDRLPAGTIEMNAVHLEWRANRCGLGRDAHAIGPSLHIL